MAPSISTKLNGYCLCGAVSFEITPPIASCVTCHCDSCRRQCAAPMTAYVGVADGQWRWTGAKPKVFQSSAGVERCFCGTCGTPMSFRSTKLANMMHLYVATLANPSAIEPQLHVAIEEKLPWLHLDDGLPVHKGPDYTKV